MATEQCDYKNYSIYRSSPHGYVVDGFGALPDNTPYPSIREAKAAIDAGEHLPPLQP